jgi:hypothetical protein
MDFLADIYADCIGYQDFADLDALLAFIESNCDDVWGDWDDDTYDCGDFDWSEEDEMDLLAEEFSDCIGDQTFADLDEMYAYIFDNCNDFDTVASDEGTSVVVIGNEDCLAGLSQGVMTFQQMILAIDANCGAEFGSELPDCFLNAPIFSTDAEFFQYLEDNCSQVFDGEDEGQAFSDSDMGALIATYNLAGANAAANQQGTVGIETIDGINMSMFPNPATDFVQMNITEDFIQDYQLFDIKGSLVRNATNLNNASVTIELEDLNVGTYFVKVATANGKTFSNAIIVR